MISHINILLQIIALLTGVWIIFYLYQTYKTYGNKLVNRMLWVSLFLNLWLLLSLTSKYINLNVTYFYSASKISWGYMIRHPLSAIALSGAVLSLLSAVAKMFGYVSLKNVDKYFKWIFTSIVLLFLAGFIHYAFYPEARWLEHLDSVLITGGISIVYISLILLMLINKHKLEKQKAVGVFSIVYGVVFLPIASFMFIIPFKLTIVSSLFIISNFVPFVWIHWYFKKYFVESINFTNNDDSLNKFVEQYGLTSREHEITELILQGKSNKEIEKMLFISAHTVRNHTHNLYKKIGVTGRGQMVGLILGANKNNH